MKALSEICAGAASHGEFSPLPYEDWVYLDRGDEVVVQRPGHARRYGTVDELSEDASYFWVWLDGHGRMLIFPGDGTLVSAPGARPRMTRI